MTDTMTADDLRYPVGRFRPHASPDPSRRTTNIADIAALPQKIRAAVAGLGDRQLDTPYRPDGWTVRQVVHHVADSHMNALIRVKLALTEDTPTIKPYDENAWSTLPDMTLPIAVSLSLIEGIHTRWIAVVNGMAVDQFSRSFVHPELKTEMTLDGHLQLYAWHSHHHLAHITELRRREGW